MGLGWRLPHPYKEVIIICPYCHNEISDQDIAKHLGARGGAIGGKSKSKAKLEAIARNAKLGGRPKKEPT